MRIKIKRKFNNNKEKKKYEAKKRARNKLKNKDVKKLTRAEKDELLIQIARMLDIVD